MTQQDINLLEEGTTVYLTCIDMNTTCCQMFHGATVIIRGGIKRLHKHDGGSIMDESEYSRWSITGVRSVEEQEV